MASRAPTPMPTGGDTAPLEQPVVENPNAESGPADAADPPEPVELAEVRVLRDHHEFVANQVAQIDARTVAAAVADGWADDDAEAVAYARSLAD